MTALRHGDPSPVQLVGAGPGHPDLLTLDAEGALAAAHVIVADRSLSSLLAALASEWAASAGSAAAPEVVWVDDDTPAPDALLAAATGSTADGSAGAVVRLYRGDPWFHPAGDAERSALAAAGVGFDLVPGVVEEVAVATAAGIPLQLRTASVATTFVVDVPDAHDARQEGLDLPADPTHALVVRTTDLRATADRLARSAGRAGRGATDLLDQPAAALPLTRAGR